MPPKSPIDHSMKRRCRNHDYSQPSIYMVTIVVAGRKPLFGRLVSNPYPNIDLTPLGKVIASEEIAKISEIYPNIKVRRYIIMPDHIHLIIHVVDEFPLRSDGKRGNLGYVVSGFKSGCLKAYKAMCDCPQIPMFEKKYHDRLIIGDRHYEKWRKYVDDNPMRLAIKREHPDYFTVLHNLDLYGYNCHIVGNRFLLDIPDKMAVIVHRADSDAEHRDNRRQWLACGDRGGVLVSAAIAPREKEVMREAMDLGYNIILLRENGFPDFYKPSGESFNACADGRLLQISPWQYHFDGRAITREQCLYLNELAVKIAAESL